MTPLRTAQAIANQGTIPIGGIIMWSGSIATIPDDWSLCDGTSGTPNLVDRFIVGAGDTYAVNDTGGADSVSLSTAQIPSHNHSFSATTNTTGSHSHSASTDAAGSHTHTGGTNSAGAHTHDAAGPEAQAATGTGVFGAGTGNARTVGSNGAHAHSLSINAAGSHSHSVSVTSAGDHSHTVSGTTGTSGSGNAHENRPPYYALAYIMRVA